MTSLLLAATFLVALLPVNVASVAGARNSAAPREGRDDPVTPVNPDLAGRVLGVQCQHAHSAAPMEGGVLPVVDGVDNPAFWNLSMFGHDTDYLDEQKSFRNILLAFSYDWFLDHSGAVAKVRKCGEKYEDFVGTDKYDSVLRNALAQGIEDNLVALLMRRTCGQTGDFSTCSPHYQLEDWATAVNKVASEYGKAIKFYEVWDEPGFDTSCGDEAASQRFGDKGYEKYADVYSDYLPVLQRAYQEIKAGEATCGGWSSTVISGSLLHFDPYLYPPDDPNNPNDGVNATQAFDVYKNLFNHIGSGPSGGGEDVSIVASSKNTFVAERPIYFSYNDYKKNGGPPLEETATVNRRGGHVAAGYPVSSSPGGSSTWYFAEGCTRADLGMEEYICVYNPNNEDVYLGRRYDFSDGSGSKSVGMWEYDTETGKYDYAEAMKLPTVPAHKRVTICVHGEAGLERDVSTYIEGFIPGADEYMKPIPKKVFAERVMYFNFRGFSGGHCAVGRPSQAKSWYFAEGTTRENAFDGRYETYICIQNTSGTAAECALTYMRTDGTTLTLSVPVGPYSRRTVNTRDDLGPDVDFSVLLISDVPVVAERPMYFSLPGGINDGSVEVGATTPRNDFYFAEGATYDGVFREYLCIQNPNPSEAKVTLTYMTRDGQSIKEFDISGRSRHTVDVNADIGLNQDVSVRVQSTKPVVAERPMYFNYDSKRDEVFIPEKRDPAEVAIRYGGGHVSSGIASPAKKYVFAEGLAGHYFEEYICLQNPNDDAINVTLDFYSKWGKCWSKTYPIEGNRRITVSVFEELALFNCCDSVGVHFLRNPLGDDGMSWVRGYRLLRNLMNEYSHFNHPDKELIVASCGWAWSQCGSSGTPMEVGEYTHEQARKGLLYAPSSGSEAGLNGLFFEDAQDRCTKAWYYIDIDGPYTVDNLLYGLYDHLNHVPTCVWSETGYEGGYKAWQEAILDTPDLVPNDVLPQR
ncbi:MAG: hypothetical protein KKE36_16360 [Actinobacteria bacterium]|nr:hypothetical protein [Actinomycetota bacterium]